jgi:hypothetical protein
MGLMIAEKLLKKLPNLLSLSEPPSDTDNPELPSEETVRILAGEACSRCSFAEHDCDFIENWNPDAPAEGKRLIPCGGFLFLGDIMDKKIINRLNLDGSTRTNIPVKEE